MEVPRFGGFQLRIDSVEWLLIRPSEGAKKVEISVIDRLGRIEDDSAGLRNSRIPSKGIIRPSDGPLGRAADVGIPGRWNDPAE